MARARERERERERGLRGEGDYSWQWSPTVLVSLLQRMLDAVLLSIKLNTYLPKCLSNGFVATLWIKGSPDNMTPLGIGKSVILIDAFQYRKILFGSKKLPYKVIVILTGFMLSGEHCFK